MFIKADHTLFAVLDRIGIQRVLMPDKPVIVPDNFIIRSMRQKHYYPVLRFPAVYLVRVEILQ